MPFEVWTWMGPRNNILGPSPDPPTGWVLAVVAVPNIIQKGAVSDAALVTSTIAAS